MFSSKSKLKTVVEETSWRDTMQISSKKIAVSFFTKITPDLRRVQFRTFNSVIDQAELAIHPGLDKV